MHRYYLMVHAFAATLLLVSHPHVATGAGTFGRDHLPMVCAAISAFYRSSRRIGTDVGADRFLGAR